MPDFDWLRLADPPQRNPLPVALAEARIALIGTAGAHLPGEPGMSPRGEVRFIPSTSMKIEFTHPGFDTSRGGLRSRGGFPATDDAQPGRAGFVGELAPTAISTMGFIPRGSRVLEDLVAESASLRATAASS